MPTQMESGTHRDGACRVCGCALVETARQTMHSPAELACPACDGDMTPEEVQEASEYLRERAQARLRR